MENLLFIGVPILKHIRVVDPIKIKHIAMGLTASNAQSSYNPAASGSRSSRQYEGLIKAV